MEQEPPNPVPRLEVVSDATELERKVGVEALPEAFGFIEPPELAQLRMRSREVPFGSEASSQIFGQYHQLATDRVMQLPAGSEQAKIGFGVEVQMWLMRRAAGQPVNDLAEDLDLLVESAWAHRDWHEAFEILEAEYKKISP
jgi:hypothetical protein